jgi:hypothetical protein
MPPGGLAGIAGWFMLNCSNSRGALAENHFSQTRIGGPYRINLGREDCLTEVRPAGSGIADHELESGLDGIAAAVMEACRRIGEQHCSAGIAEFNRIFPICY